MKNKLIFFFLLFSSQVFCQSFVCGENQQEIIDKFNMQNTSTNSLTPPNYDATTKYVFNVFYHVVYNDDGVTRTNYLGDPGIIIGFEEIMNSIRDLNINFNQFNIFLSTKDMIK